MKRKSFGVFALCALGSWMWACSDDSSDTDAGPIESGTADVKTDVGVPSDSGNDTGVLCHNEPQLAVLIDEVRLAQAPPTPFGGPIADGTYVATQASMYTGDGGKAGKTGTSFQVTTVVQGNTFKLAGGTNIRQTGTFTADDAGNFQATILCPLDASPSTYTSFVWANDGGTIELLNPPDAGVVTGLTYTKK